MQYRFLSKFSISLFITLCLLSYAASSSAHDAGATMDAAGISRTFTGVAIVTCFDDGNGPAEKLIAQIRDNSPSVPGLLVNLQIFKNNKAVSITDTVSGDAEYSPFVELHGGNGVYFVFVNKTDVGARDFDLTWHCLTEDDIHTGTEISVSQFN